jgi:GTP-binding protein
VSGEVRSVVHDVAGTTVDPVDSLVELDGEVFRFVDTAGLRKRVKMASGMEYYASLRTSSAIESAEVALVLIDASEPIAEQDQRVLTMVVSPGAPWSSCSTSGTRSTRSAATSSPVSWSAT